MRVIGTRKDEIDKYLGNNGMASVSPGTYRALAREDDTAYSALLPKSTKDCALWLRKYRPPEELEDFLKRHHPEVCWWLNSQAVR